MTSDREEDSRAAGRRSMRAPRLVVPFALSLLATLLIACGGDANDGAPELGATSADGAAITSDMMAAPEIVGIGTWLNGEPTTIVEQVIAGRIVLIDFWTYTCINCIRTLPFIVDWDAKYAEHGLTIVGVHSPEFDFEKQTENVQAAIERHGIRYRVAQDNDFETWRAFGNRFWPAKYLIDSNGAIVYQHFGEGSYLETEAAIREALEAAGADLSGIQVGGVEEPTVDPQARGQTRELYGGYQRAYTSQGLYAAQETYYLGADRTEHYEDINASTAERGHQQWYLQGLWRNEREAIVHARVTEDLEDYIALRVVARSVNVVLTPRGEEPYIVFIELDGRPLRATELGEDAMLDEQGRSVILVDEPRIYAIVELPEYGDHELKLRSNSDDFAIFAFTFGVYTEGS